MKVKNKTIVLIIIPVILLIAGVVVLKKINQGKINFFSLSVFYNEKESQDPEVFFESENIQVNDNDFLYSAIKNIDKKEVAAKHISGGIVPHHDLASPLIAQFFYELREHNPKVENIIILAPKHEEMKQIQIFTGMVRWQTEFGDLEQNDLMIRDLLTRKSISLNQEEFVDEHSVKVLTPFIKYYFPQAKIVPILFTAQHDYQSSLALADDLRFLLKTENVVIASIDFSHYLPNDRAAICDEKSLRVIEDLDYEEASKLNGDYVDSPAALTVFLKLMQSKYAEAEVLDHKNSADFLKKDLDSSTSYFTVFFY